LLGFAAASQAQTALETKPEKPPAAAPDAAPPAPPPSAWTRWNTNFSVMLDGYADVNFNHPGSGNNGLANFDLHSDTAGLSLAKLSVDHAPAPFGIRLDIGFGETLSFIHVDDPGPPGMKYVEQAFVSFKPKSWKGFQVDFGKFVTSAGAEVIEAYSNWNYTRSLLFVYAVPYYHMGLRTSFPVGKHFTAGVQVVNGWNNDRDQNSGKTIGLVAAYSWKKVTWSNNYYVGPEKHQTNKGLRNLFDTTVQYNQNDKTSYYVNFDYDRDKNIGSGSRQWTGIAFAGRRALGKKFAIAPRFEFYNDVDGFTTGTPQQVKEFTLTGEYKMRDWLVSRLEFRDDWSDKNFFDTGTNRPLGKNQPRLVLGMMAYFGPKK
jgi:Putative beta-barrel porin-2, OmpL-like. bbp2